MLCTPLDVHCVTCAHCRSIGCPLSIVYHGLIKINHIYVQRVCRVDMSIDVPIDQNGHNRQKLQLNGHQRVTEVHLPA